MQWFKEKLQKLRHWCSKTDKLKTQLGSVVIPLQHVCACVCVYTSETEGDDWMRGKKCNMSHERGEEEKRERGEWEIDAQQGGWWKGKRSSETCAFPPRLKLNTRSFHLTRRPHTQTRTHTHTQSHEQRQNKGSQQLWDGVHKHHLLSRASKTHILSEYSSTSSHFTMSSLSIMHYTHTHAHKCKDITHTHTHAQKRWQRQIQRIIKRAS